MSRFLDKRAKPQQAATCGSVGAWSFLVIGAGAGGGVVAGPGGGITFATVGAVLTYAISRGLCR